MPNAYFKFKQFTVYQDKCEMKVCTDACLFGAWLAAKVVNQKVQKALDIGTGTGLLTLLLAQKTNAHIIAVELDTQAALQATENFNASPWRERLLVENTSIQHFFSEEKYDLIFSNPPFFKNSLQSENNLKNMAKHATDLPLTILADKVDELLTSEGKFGLLLPWQEFDNFRDVAARVNLHPAQITYVQQTPAHPYFRTMGIFTRKPSPAITQETIVIKNSANEYTYEFKELLKDFYLYL